MVENILNVTKIHSPDGNLEGNFGYEDGQGLVSTAISGSTQWTIEKYRDANGPVLPFMASGQNDYVQIIIQMPHRKKFGKIKSLHVHTIPMKNPTVDKYVVWQVKYYWFSTNEVLPASSNWIVPSVPRQVISNGDEFKHKIHTLVSDFSHPGVESASSILIAQITRLGTNVNDTYNDQKTYGTGLANLAILYFDIHYEADSTGTAGEFS